MTATILIRDFIQALCKWPEGDSMASYFAGFHEANAFLKKLRATNLAEPITTVFLRDVAAPAVAQLAHKGRHDQAHELICDIRSLDVAGNGVFLQESLEGKTALEAFGAWLEARKETAPATPPLTNGP